jgi:hypothetical protein
VKTKSYAEPLLFKENRQAELRKELSVLDEVLGSHDTYGDDGRGKCPCSSCKRYVEINQELEALSE